MNSYLDSPQKIDALLHMWQTVSSDPTQLATCNRETSALADALQSSNNAQEIASVANRIMELLTHEGQESVINLIARDIAHHGVKGQADKSNLYFVMEKLQSALKMPKQPPILPRLFSCAGSSQLAEAKKAIRNCQKKIHQVREKAWLERNARGYPLEKSSYFHLLPSSVLSVMIPKIPFHQWLSLARGDQKFKNAVIEAINNEKVHLSDLKVGSDSRFRAFIDLFGHDLTVLKLRYLPISNENIRYASANMPRLKRLDLNDTQIDDGTLQELIKNCPYLTVVDLENCNQLSDASLSRIASLQHLTQLDLVGCKKISDATLQLIAQNCPKLERVGLDEDLTISNSTIELFARNWSNLEMLMLPKTTEHSDASIQLLFIQCKKLRELTLLGSPDLSDTTLQLLAKHHPDLEWLGISNSPLVSDSGLCSIVRQCHKLKDLKVYDAPLFTDATIYAIAEHCPQIEHFNVENTSHISEEALTILAEKCPLLKDPLSIDSQRLVHTPLDQWLAQAEGPHARRNAIVRKSIARMIDENEISVAMLGISNSHQLQKFLTEYEHDLDYLDLRGCNFLTNAHFQQIGQHLPHLKELYIDFENFNDCHLRDISQCAELEKLILKNCKRIHDYAIQDFVNSHPDILRLGLMNCPEISEAALQYILQHCPQLQRLHFEGIKLSMPTVRMMHNHPHLNFNMYTNLTSSIKDRILDVLERLGLVQ